MTPRRRAAAGAVVAAALIAATAGVAIWHHRRTSFDLAALADELEPDAGVPAAPPPATTLVLHVTERGRPVGARVLLFGPAPATEALRIGAIVHDGLRPVTTACELAPGVVGSWDGLIAARGTAEVPVGGGDPCAPSPAIPYGRYRVWAWRGIEYERWEGEVDLSAGRGRVELAIALERAWIPYGTLAADLHVHAIGSNDSDIENPQRVIAQVASGIQVVALSDHNRNGDLDAEIATLGLGDVIASLASNELSSAVLHVGAYPVDVLRGLPRGGSPATDALAEADARAVFAAARKLGPDPVIQLNHPRLRWAGLYDSAAWDGVAWPPPFPLGFDAVEVIAGHTAFNVDGDRRLDESVRDFYTLVDHGRLVAPLANSDTHDLSAIVDGTARTYVFVDRPMAQDLDEAAFVAAIRARRVVATTGPWLDVEVAAARGAPSAGPGQGVAARGTAWVDVTVEAARWVRVDRLRIAVGGRRPRTIDVPPGARRFRWTGAVEVGAADTWIGVTADGDTALPLELTGTLQRDLGRPGVTPIALASPVLVDADGDGRWRRGGTDLPLPAPRP